jgi:hypothetical protein
VKLARWLAIIALALLGISSVVGAIPMIVDPDGTPWRMPQSLLDSSPFDSFLIPGIMLFIANGVLSLASLIGVVRKDPGYGGWVILQGGVLALWLAVEVAMIRHILDVHYLYGGLAVIMIVSGILLKRTPRPA